MTAALDWAPPPSPDLMLLPAGRHWDAVRTDTDVADWVTPMLDADGPASICDPRTGHVVWLIPPGRAALAPWATWERLHPYVTVLPTVPEPAGITYIGVPPTLRRRGPGPHWRVPRGWAGTYLADADWLSAVLAPAVMHVYGVDALPLQCQVCDRSVSPLDAVTAIGRRYATDLHPRRLTAHPGCARRAHMIIEESSR